jgi:formamidopyrimidine-DNA glycosylase
MPELPEVEVTRRGVLAALAGARVSGVVVRNRALRYPVPEDLGEHIAGRTLVAVARRAKYLLLDFGVGEVLIHLGMSGSLRVVPSDMPPRTHDHVDLVFGDRVLRLHDPRRFGAVLWLGRQGSDHPLLRSLGVEPLAGELSARQLHAATRRRSAAIKQVLMDNRLVVGVGNIYAAESLFRAGIRPTIAAKRVSLARWEQLVESIRTTLADALEAGGSTLRDFVASDGSPGYFQQGYFVYGRAGEPCRCCGTPIRAIRQGRRSSFFCPVCQR